MHAALKALCGCQYNGHVAARVRLLPLPPPEKDYPFQGKFQAWLGL